MKNTTIKTTLIVTGLLLVVGRARAAYEEIGIGPRVTGLGNAYTAVADDAYAIHYNPAGLANLSRPELATSYSKLLTGLSDSSNLQNSFLAYASPIKDGRYGAYGVAWNYFTLDNLYRESSMYLSYGKAVFEETHPNKFFAGFSFKYLNRSVGSSSAATNSVGNTGIVSPGVSDPVLQNNSRSNIDLDWGVLYRVKPRLTLGMAVQHFLEPNVAFSAGDSDPLKRNIKFGAAYKTPFSTLSSDLDFLRAPDGTTDKHLSLGAEKWLPTLLHGAFGVRGSLAIGSRSYRQVGVGLSYRLRQLQFDYGFTIPLGGIAGTAGSHRLGLVFRFGRAGAAQPTLAEAVVENLNDLAAVGTPEFKYQMEDLALFKRTAIDEMLRQAKVDASAGKFADAQEKLDQAASLKPGDPKIEASRDRLKIVAGIYPQVAEFSIDPAQAAIYQGSLDFLIGKDREALKKLAYAQTLQPGEQKLDSLVEAIERRSGLVRQATPAPVPSGEKAAPTLGAEKIVAGNMALMEVALREREYDKVVKLASQVIELDAANALAYKRMGSAYYAQRKHAEALKALRSAHKLERDPEEKKQLRSYIDALSAVVEQKTRPAAQSAAQSESRGPASPQDLERWYEAGVDHYAHGQLNEAAAMFKKILDADASNISARRAYDRVQSELMQGGKK